MLLLVFFHQQSPCTWSLPYLYEQNTLLVKCGGVNPPNSTSESSEFDNRLTTIDERTTAIQGMLHNHTQWQATMGHEMAASSNNNNSKIKIARLCPSTSTSGHLVEQPWQQPAWGRRHSPCIQISISFLLLFLVWFIYIRKKDE